MKKIGYSAGVKAAVILLQEMFSVVLVVCIILVSTLFDKSMLDIGEVRNTAFEESKYYVGLFENALKEILNYAEYQKQFETDGVYNPEKAVNIMAYWHKSPEAVNVKTNMRNSDKFRYYLDDLDNWSKEYAQQHSVIETKVLLTENKQLRQVQRLYLDDELVNESVKEIHSIRDMNLPLQSMVLSNVERIYGGNYEAQQYEWYGAENNKVSVFSEVENKASAESVRTESENGVAEPFATEEGAQPDVSAEDRTDDEKLKELIQRVKSGELYDMNAQELALILDNIGLLDVASTTEGTILEEKYRTVDGATILESFLREEITVQEMQQAFVSLKYTLDNIGNEITAYKRMVNKYEKEKSNVQFFIYAENENQYYTNIKEVLSWGSLPAYGEKLGSYFYYNKNDIRLDTNVAGMEDAFYEQFESRNNGRNSIIFMGIHTGFPQNDSFYQARQEYNQLQPWAIISLIAIVISLFGSFLCLIYLSLVSGKSSQDDEVHLNWFDRIKTEVVFLAFGVFSIVSVLIFQELILLFENSDLIGMMIMAGGLTFTIVAVFMVFYMSFVRRLKAGIMWSGSAVCWVVKGIQKIMRNWKPSIRIIAAFSLHVAVTVFLAYFAIAAEDIKFSFLILLLYLLLCAAEMLVFLREGVQRNTLIRGIKRIAGGELEYEIDTEQLKGENKLMGEAINTIGEGLHHAVDDSMKNERLKADLITNVSHDIKTPLTSIINYVDLLKREDLDNPRARSYIDVLDAKSQRLKQLTEDLVEASKVSSGNVKLQMERLNFVELVYQTAGEFNEKFEARGLTAVTRLPREPVVILADGRRIWRVIENLYNNVAKYAMENTRVYVDMEVLEPVVSFSIKNISQQALNIDASELTERFIRGDVSRSTEGSGLGLSIAKSLTQLMGGTFDIYLDGDLFKVTVTFPVAKEQ